MESEKDVVIDIETVAKVLNRKCCEMDILVEVVRLFEYKKPKAYGGKKKALRIRFDIKNFFIVLVFSKF